MNETTLPDIKDAKQSDIFETVASIAGASVHTVSARTLLEDCTAEVFDRQKYSQGRMVPVFKTIILKAGETIYLRPSCGQIRPAKYGMVYRNDFRPADEVTCQKCLAKKH